ncbi:MAG: efflux RND transporter periplasmic adaptor subunit [Zetaproteobacteria bacterium]|nr:efflux RND transporter periplasmic adaptor subunit [Zetaproteobacteria bacterium]
MNKVGSILLVIFLMPKFSWAAFSLDDQEMRAQLMPVQYTTLSAELAGKIERITVREGESFRKGQPLIIFDCSLQKAQMKKAEAQRVAAKNADDGNKRLHELNAIGQVELQASHAELLKAEADIDYLQVTLNKCVIQAPFHGVSSKQEVREQQYVQAGQSLLEIVDNSHLELQFIVPSRWLSWLTIGTVFDVYIDDTAQTYSVTLQRIAAMADPVSQSVKAVARISGHHPELIAGMSGKILLKAPNDSPLAVEVVEQPDVMEKSR